MYPRKAPMTEKKVMRAGMPRHLLRMYEMAKLAASALLADPISATNCRWFALMR